MGSRVFAIMDCMLRGTKRLSSLQQSRPPVPRQHRNLLSPRLKWLLGSSEEMSVGVRSVIQLYCIVLLLEPHLLEDIFKWLNFLAAPYLGRGRYVKIPLIFSKFFKNSHDVMGIYPLLVCHLVTFRVKWVLISP